jgi:hypothetical protein
VVVRIESIVRVLMVAVSIGIAAVGCDWAIDDDASFEDAGTVRRALTPPGVPWIATEKLRPEKGGRRSPAR